MVVVAGCVRGLSRSLAAGELAVSHVEVYDRSSRRRSV